MRIMVDVSGGDSPTSELVKGGISAAREMAIDVGFAGDKREIETALISCGEREGNRFSVVPSSQVIGMDEPPVRAVRGKPDSSLVNALNSLDQGAADAVVSPGNTGAVVAGSIFILGRIREIPRPGIAASLPTLGGDDVVVIDVGANVDCAPAHMEGFAIMGSHYVREVLGVSRPNIGLLNIGAEKEKGNKLTYRAFERLEKSSLSFFGNVEGHELLSERPVDVVVCDGFVGNVFLKTIEGAVFGVVDFVKNETYKRLRSKVGAQLMKPVFTALRDKLAYQRRGGAPLLGVDGVVVIAHGRSDADAIFGAMDVARREVAAKLNTKIRKAVKTIDGD